MDIMKRMIALLFALLVSVSSVMMLASCEPKTEPGQAGDGEYGGEI